jgi:hypothetical protein
MLEARRPHSWSRQKPMMSHTLSKLFGAAAVLAALVMPATSPAHAQATQSSTQTRDEGTRIPGGSATPNHEAELADRPRIPDAVDSSSDASARVDSTDMASVGSAPEGSAATPPVDNSQLVRSLQRELRKVGCLSGEPDGVWGEQSKTALKSFVRLTKLSVSSDEPSAAVLDAATAARGRICPLVCDEGEHVVGGRCVDKPRPARAREANQPKPQAAPRARNAYEAQPSKGVQKLCFGPDRNTPPFPCN